MGMINKTEQEIMQNWESDKMMVSITCVAFNHEDYIHTTLNSFLEQETTFPFEIIINDDVSTDKTVDILKEYEAKYPNIVKPVYQTENQFSQGINTMAILFPLVTGKYVAFCDGDDFWVDKEKLQIQVTEMEKHPEVDLSFHSSYRLVGDERVEMLAKRADHNKIFPVQNSILGQGDFTETAAMMFTSSLIHSLPEWFKTSIPGDYISEIMGAQRGGSLYIDRCMSVYRSGLESGWTENESKKSTEERKKTLFDFIGQLDFLDNYLKKKYHAEFDSIIHKAYFDFICSVNNNHEVKAEIFARFKNSFTLKEKMLWHFIFKHQNLIQALKLMKNSLAKTKISIQLSA